MDRRTTFGFALALLVIIATGGAAFVEVRSAGRAWQWSRHTFEMLDRIARVSKRLVDAESGERGYVLTGRSEYLGPYRTATNAVFEDLDALRALVVDNPAQEERRARLAPLVASILDDFQRTILLRASRGLEPALEMLQADHEKQDMDRTRVLLDEMAATERVLLQERLAEHDVRRLRATLFMLIASGFAFMLVAASTIALDVQTRARLRAQRGLAKNEEWLRVTLRSIGDGVIATDRTGAVVFVNPVAEALMGHDEASARGRPLGEVFAIVDEQTHTPVDSPVDRVLREGAVIALGNDTLLVRPDGREIPIDDSGAPIRDGDEIVGVVLVFRDVTERRRLEQERDRLIRVEAAHQEAERGARALRVSEERYRSLVMASHSTVWTAGPGGRVETPQSGWEAYTGQTWPEDRDLGWLRRVHEADHEQVQTAWSAAEAAGAVFEVEARVWHAASHQYRYCRARGVPLLESDGSLREWVGTLEDVHERKGTEMERERLLRDTERARADAEAANHAKDEFLSMLSHELRSPLQTMVNWVRVLRAAGTTGPQIARAGEVLLQSIRTQEQLIDDLLDVSRIVSGKLTVEMRPFDLAAAAAACVEHVQPAAEAKGVAMVHEAPAGSLMVFGDSVRLHQALGNVLQNAVKFTPAGGRISLRARRLPDRAEIEVSDTGEGIAAELLPHVFDRFWQADSAKTRRHGGLGLGLAIAQSLVTAQGGTITAESAGAGRGSTFRIVLRLAPPEWRETPSEADGNGRAESLERLHVLLVEDDASTCEALAMILQDLGARVSPAGSVRAALQLVDDAMPDVVVSDVGMPGESGYALVRAIRAREAGTGSHVPALAMTGFASKEDRDEARQSGFDDHLAKPVDPDLLIARIQQLVRRFPPASSRS